MHLRIDDSVRITRESLTRGMWRQDWIKSYCVKAPAEWARDQKDWIAMRQGCVEAYGKFGDHLCKIGDHIIVLTDEEYQARVGDPWGECETIVSDWINRDNAQLWAGEFSAQEWRAVKAVLTAIQASIRNLGKTNDAS